MEQYFDLVSPRPCDVKAIPTDIFVVHISDDGSTNNYKELQRVKAANYYVIYVLF